MKPLHIIPRLLLLCTLLLAAGTQAAAQTTASYIYEKVTSEDGLVAGDTYLIVNEEKNIALSYQDDDNRKSFTIAPADGKLTIFTNEIAATNDDQSKVFELTLGGETGAWTFYDKANSGYLYAASSSKNYLKVKSELTDNSKATITFSEGDATITFQGDNTRNVIRVYNKLFSCYEAGKQKAVQLYRKKTSTLSITDAGYSTIYLAEPFEMPEGVTGYTVTSTDNKTITLNATYPTSAAYPANAAVPAQTALLLKGEEGDYTYAVLSYTEAAPTDNLLHGTTEDATTSVEGAAAYYKLSKGSDGKVGFYWGAAKGGAFTNGANKAYLAMPQGGDSPALSFDLDKLGATTTSVQAIPTAISTAAAPARISDLNGRSLSTLRGAQKGVYIVNGKKVLVK